MRKRSKNVGRRPRPLKAPANTYRVPRPAPSMANIRAYLERRRQLKARGQLHYLDSGDQMGAAMEKAFSGIGKKPVLTRRQAFLAREARRASLATA